MPSGNRVLKKVLVNKVYTKNGQEINLHVAVRTDDWWRTEEMARNQGPAFTNAVNASLDVVPTNAHDVIQRLVDSLQSLSPFREAIAPLRIA